MALGERAVELTAEGHGSPSTEVSLVQVPLISWGRKDNARELLCGCLGWLSFGLGFGTGSTWAKARANLLFTTTEA